MEWTIESYDRGTDRDGENRYATESAFISAAEDLLHNVRKGFVSATLPDGRIVVHVHQIVRDLDGKVILDRTVQHIYRLEGAQILSMEIAETHS